MVLCKNWNGVDARCQKAYENAKACGEHLKDEVAKFSDEPMEMHFVTEAAAQLGLTTSTFAFNLPAKKNSSAAEKKQLAQTFTDKLCLHPGFKPCVSFGQDNGLIYATVPATSTQGAIKEEDKAKQAKGGVQLCRLSFPPTIDVQRIKEHTTKSVKELY